MVLIVICRSVRTAPMLILVPIPMGYKDICLMGHKHILLSDLTTNNGLQPQIHQERKGWGSHSLQTGPKTASCDFRWQHNPQRDWGPKPRARQGHMETLDDRRTKGIKKSIERRAKRKVKMFFFD